MSRLIISSLSRGFTMNVVAFNSPVYGSIGSAQTRSQQVNFPIKMDQPNIQFDVVFSSEPNYQDFQKFVRTHQKQALSSTSLLTLQWPERNILNWTGVIKEFKAGGSRFNYLPRARFTVELVNSMVSRRTDLASFSPGWRSIYGEYGPIGSVLRAPTLSDAQFLRDFFGDPAGITLPGSTPPPTGNLPVVPQLPGGGGILSGTG